MLECRTRQATPTPASRAHPCLQAADADKKRKRASAAHAPAQVEALEALFALDTFAKTAVKQELATAQGLELAQVNKWFDKRRKQQREQDGTAPKRGRPAQAAPAALGSPAAVAPAEVQQQQQQQEQQAPAAAASSPMVEAEAEAEASPDKPAAMAVDSEAAPEATPAAPAAPEAAPAPPPPAASQPTPSTVAAAAAATPAAPPQSGAAAKAPERTFSPEELATLEAELSAEAAQLQAGGLPAPLVDFSLGAERVPFSDAKVSQPPSLTCLFEGCRAAAGLQHSQLTPAKKTPRSFRTLAAGRLRGGAVHAAVAADRRAAAAVHGPQERGRERGGAAEQSDGPCSSEELRAQGR